MISNEVGSESDGFFSQACDRRQIHLELLFFSQLSSLLSKSFYETQELCLYCNLYLNVDISLNVSQC